MKIDFLKLISAIIICELAGVIGSVFTIPAISTWYVTINKPFFTPPNWLFSPVWVTLFFLMGISLYLVWVSKKRGRKTAIKIFGIQLALNVIWSVLFFGLRSPLLGFMEIIILWIAILFTVIRFHKISKNAAYLLLPYIIWVTVAAALNLSILLLN